ncbi:sodium/hydrogen exchanger 10-like [Coccinella septempunctata]|uniref:sodium/hydrogen exchanger 10-like n=1 Tax=Coccinella septempunctata TaxID=41139 RepID=UPI001D08E819|nr:sodium/hydrogen exchanger 10-like [Coccinella septempunctata]
MLDQVIFSKNSQFPLEVQYFRLSRTNNRNSSFPEEIIPILFLSCTLSICACVRLVFEKLKLKFSVSPFMLIFGVFIGFMFHLADRKDIVKKIFQRHPRSLWVLVVPVMIYNMCITFDTNLLGKSCGQIFIIALPGLLINVSLVALIFNRITTESTLRGFLLTLMFAPIYPMDMMVYLKTVSAASRRVLTILQGESLIGTCIAFMLHNLLVEIELKRMHVWWEYLVYFGIYLGGGVSIGYICGKTISRMMLCSSHDPIQTILITWIGPFLIYFIVTAVLGAGSGLVNLSVQGIIVAQKKRSLSKESKMLLEKFWNFLALCTNSWGLLIVGMILGLDVLKDITYEDFAFVVLEYLINLIARSLEFLSIFWILRKVGYGITINHLIVLVWGGILSIINLSIILQTYEDPEYHDFTRGALFHGTGATLLTMIINVSTIPYLLHYLNLSTISLIKQANMNKCIKRIMSARDHAVDVLKLERFFCDSNWPFIQENTVIVHPFRIENVEKYKEIENEIEFEKIVFCPECHHDATINSTKKELEDMTREARRRILKAKQVSYSRQYECGMLTYQATSILINEVEFAMEGDFIIHTENLIKLFRPSVHLVHFRFSLLRMFHDGQEDWLRKKPRMEYRKFCYIVVFNPYFEDFVCFVILMDVVLGCAEIILRLQESGYWNNYCVHYVVFKSLSFVCFMVYLVEFTMKVLALAVVYIWKDGVASYFRSNWRRFEFSCLLISFAILLFEITESFSLRLQGDRPSILSIVICCLGMITVVRLARLVHRIHPLVERFIDGRINNRVTLAYSVGKGYMIGEDDVLHILPNVLLKRQLIEEMKREVESDKAAISKELSLIQRERPLVAINVKTREAIATILNTMYEAVGELKLMGWVDDVERRALNKAIGERESSARHLGFVPASTPQAIFEGVTWMGKDEKVLRYLWSNSKKNQYESGEYVCEKNEVPEGVYVIISGLFKSIYKPDEEVLKRYYKFGNLPVVDYISASDVDKELEDIFLSGNTIGEMAVLSQRPYDCSVVSDGHSQAYLIRTEHLLEAMEMDDDPINGLRARMWTSISLRLAFEVLAQSPMYFSVAIKEIESTLLRSVVPDLEGVKVFATGEIIEDIVLINGVVMDFNTKMIFYAPCYIPRNIKKIVFPPNSSMDFQTKVSLHVEPKLLLITRNDVDRNALFAHIKLNCQFVEDVLS